MRSLPPTTFKALFAAILALGVLALTGTTPVSAAPAGGTTVGGGTTGGGATTMPTKPTAATKKRRGPRSLRGWVTRFTTTEYYPTPEHWFAGPKQSFPGLDGMHRVAWLLSAHGVAMEGDGWSTTPTGEGTRWVNYVSGSAGWLNARGRPTSPGGGPLGWSNGAPAWLACGWKNRRGGWTFPRNYLQKGEPVQWANGRPARWVGCNTGQIQFQAGTGRALRFWNSVAVDPSIFPLGRTWFYLPAYRGSRCGGWFRADDTGGAIAGRHLDVYRPPPQQPSLTGTRSDQRILIVRGRKPPQNPCR